MKAVSSSLSNGLLCMPSSSMYALVRFARDGSCRLDAPGRSERSAVVRLLVVNLDARPFMLEESRKSDSKASGLVVDVRLGGDNAVA